MLPKQKFLFNIFGLGLFLVVVAVLVLFDRPIRRIVNVPRQMVAGVKDVNTHELNKETFQKEIEKDSKDIVNDLTYQVMNTSVSDILSIREKAEKVITDVSFAKDGLVKTIKGSVPTSLPLNK